MDNPKQAYGDKKPPFHTIPSSALLELAVRMGDGARKYGAFNWRDVGVQAMTYVGAMHRHLAAYADGENVDPECPLGSSHLAGIMACAAILLDCEARGNLIDNRPPSAPTGERIRHYQQHGRLP
jgi:hypothetical protein